VAKGGIATQLPTARSQSALAAANVASMMVEGAARRLDACLLNANRRPKQLPPDAAL